MTQSEWTLIGSLITLVFASIVGPCVTYFLSEARMAKQREWDRQDRAQTATLAAKNVSNLTTIANQTKDETVQVKTRVTELNRRVTDQQAQAGSRQTEALRLATEALRLATENSHSIEQAGFLSRSRGRLRPFGTRVDAPLRDDEPGNQS
jgi:hypothetical protein